jgi:hypothetical protein
VPIVKLGRLTRIRVDALEALTSPKVVEPTTDRTPWWEALDR